MLSYLAGAVGLLVAYFVYRLFSSFLTSRRHARNAARLGCKLPPARPYNLPLGVDLVRRVMKADQEKRVLDMFIDVYNELGCPGTWRQPNWTTENIVTVDPKNIQAILATQFNDFAIGKERRSNFFPMLGNGIFTADGKAW